MKKISFKWKDKIYTGILVNEVSDIYEIKLENGYNVGLLKKDVEIINEELIKSDNKPTTIENEEGDVVLLLCGGTILSKVDYTTGGVAPNLNIEEIKSLFPELKNERIGIKLIFDKLSENIYPSDWEIIANNIFKVLSKRKRVVILHGTDTMHYSASAMAFAFPSLNNPIVFTGSQRSSDRPSSDAHLNLLNAITVSKQPIGESVIVMHSSINDDNGIIIRGVRARKMHSTRRDAFKSINSLPLGFVKQSNVQLNEDVRKSSELIFKNGFSKDVGLLYLYPGISEEVINFYSKYKAIVLIGTGLGHAPIEYIGDSLKELSNKRVVVITTQTLYGRVNLNVYKTGKLMKSYGIIGSGLDILPETAYVKMSWILNKTDDRDEIARMYYENIAGEFSNRSYFV